MKSSEFLTAAPRFDLIAAAARQPWSWLGAIAQRVGVAVEIVNESGAPLPQVVTAPASPMLRDLIANPGSPELRTAMAAAIRTHERQRVSTGGVEVVCAPLTVGDSAIGALLLARESVPQANLAATTAELDSIGQWLAQAVAAQLDVPNDDGEAFDRVSSLHRLLHDAVDRGIEREVLVAFAEALLAWDGIEVKGYAEDLQGQFVLAVATPGTDRTQPRTLADEGAWSDDVATRLSPADALRLGFLPGKDVLLARVGGVKSQPWLVAFSGAFEARDESRVRLYVDLLGEALGRVATIAETRTTWAVLQQLLGAGNGVDQAGEAALAELARAVDAVGAALVITSSNGAPLLSLGEGEAVSLRPSGSRDQLISTLPVLEGCTMALAVRRPRGQAFARREQHIVDRAAVVFAAWLPGVLKTAPHGQDRRTEARGFDSTMDRTAAQAVEDGLDVSIVVLSATSAVLRPGMLHEWVTRFRAVLRPSDLAGALSDREIGMLLSGVAAKDVGAIRSRLLRDARIDDPSGIQNGFTIGTASRAAGSPAGSSLVRLARQDAVRRTGGPTTQWP